MWINVLSFRIFTSQVLFNCVAILVLGYNFEKLKIPFKMVINLNQVKEYLVLQI